MTNAERQTEIFRNLTGRVEGAKSLLDDARRSEAATRFHLIDPVIHLLGYRGRDVEPEHPIRISGWNVDYALKRGGEPLVLIEAKKHGHTLGKAEKDQLTRYFPHSEAMYGLLTDGQRYIWFKKQTKRSKVHAERFLVHDALDPTHMEAEWLAAISHEGSDASELDRLSMRMRIESQLYAWLTGTFLERDQRDKNLQQLSKAVGLTVSDTDLLREAARRAMKRILSDHGSEVEPSSSSELSHQAPGIATSPKSKVRYVEVKGERLDLGNGVALDAKKLKRAWRAGGRGWNVAANATKLTTAVLSLLLKHDARRDSEASLADLHKLIIFSESEPIQWVDKLSDFQNLYWDKNVNNEDKVRLLKSVAGKLQFDPPGEGELTADPTLEVWLVSGPKQGK